MHKHLKRAYALVVGAAMAASAQSVVTSQALADSASVGIKSATAPLSTIILALLALTLFLMVSYKVLRGASGKKVSA